MLRTFALATAFAATAESAFAAGHSKNIVEIAAADERFTTLVAAVTAADLGETLSGEGPFTVFAPTDKADLAELNGSNPAANAVDVISVWTSKRIRQLQLLQPDHKVRRYADSNRPGQYDPNIIEKHRRTELYDSQPQISGIS